MLGVLSSPWDSIEPLQVGQSVWVKSDFADNDYLRAKLLQAAGGSNQRYWLCYFRNPESYIWQFVRNIYTKLPRDGREVKPAGL